MYMSGGGAPPTSRRQLFNKNSLKKKNELIDNLCETN